MDLQTRSLGRSELHITTVGFGAWAVGGGGWAFGWGPQDDADSVRAITHAVDRGVNWVDTAGVYGLGHSEEVVGRALAGMPAADRPLVFPKCGLKWDSANPMTPAAQNSEPASLRLDIENSLRRLAVDRIDLFQIHWPDEVGTPVEDYWGEMARFVDEGKVRAIGVSNFDVALLERCEAVRHVDSLQPPFSLIRPGAGRHGTTVPAVAVAWTLTWPGVSGAIVGARTPAQVDGWLPAGSLVLTPADLTEIASAVERLGVGPA